MKKIVLVIILYSLIVNVFAYLIPDISINSTSLSESLGSSAIKQRTLSITNNGGSVSIMNYDIIIEEPTVRDISGSTFTSTETDYEPDTTFDLHLSIYNASIDDEWLDGATLDFPVGVTVNSSTDFIDGSGGELVSDSSTGDGVTITWSDSDGGNGEIHDYDTAIATVNISVDSGFSGYMNMDWTLSGDDWGGPLHDISGTLTLSQASANPTDNIFEDDFETDKLWSLSGEFERAAPGGLGGNYGNADPTSAYAGSNVLGVDLSGTGTYSGDYEVSLTDRAYQAESPTIDCSDYNNVALSFYRWLNVEEPTYDHAYIDINNGSGWQQIWTNSSGIEDAVWSQQNFDISAYADGKATVQIRFCMGGSDTAWQYSGWNIDNLIISGESTAIPGYGEGNNLGDPAQPVTVDVEPIDIDDSLVDPDVTIDPDGDLGITVTITVTDEVQGSIPVPNPDNVIISYAVDVIGTITGVNLDFDLEFTGLSDLDQIHWLNGTNWEVPNNVSWSTPNHVIFDLTLSDRDASTEIILSGDNPLPVTLSSFTAVYSNSSPVINWVTQSESDNIGWNIYRSISLNFGQAFMLNLETIPGNGTTSQPSFYSYIDEYEVYESLTYWYWLESISGSGETESYGPVSLTIPPEGNNIPEIPLVTELRQNFPNPFNPSTLISFDIKENETGILSIYNIKGQLILTEEFETGRHQFAWDARDKASGVYLYKLQTKRFSKIMKMLLVK